LTLQKIKKTYRKGAIGALTDEYEKALDELKVILLKISDDKFKRINEKASAQDFQSIRNIILHIISSGYVYANHIRKRFEDDYIIPELEVNSTEQGVFKLNEMFEYTVETFQDKWLLTDEELLNTIIKTSWTTYDLEALIEHSIVHILRHRLQIEKMIIKYGI